MKNDALTLSTKFQNPNISHGFSATIMLSRFISRPSNLRFLTLISYSYPPLSSLPSPPLPSPILHLPNPNLIPFEPSRTFSSNRKNNGDNTGDNIPSNWNFSPENETDDVDSVFGTEEGSLSGIADESSTSVGSDSILTVGSDDDLWSKDSSEKEGIFEEIDKEFGSRKRDENGGEDWETAEGYEPWTFDNEGERGEGEGIFGGGIEGLSNVGDEGLETEMNEADKKLQEEEQELSITLKGPNRAFGDLIAISGITEAMLDSLIALKDLEGVEGLPPLREIEDMRLEKNERKSTRAEMERKKQEEIAKARVRQVDEQGRAYGTGRRKCSIARVWIHPGDGKFIVNDKEFDAYFPILDHRADLLRPFVETKTLGLWDVNCTVKGGGVSGQVGAIRLGISRALQNWEPGLRPPLRSAGFLTRDPRVVERKKPGKAKARKSFQWVKR
ncbi:ribosomal protein S5 domain 2-like superfamily protein [Tasmannia lanceolata]|uniref:ribosomal protein S5 domain 2-like superfamily protein n=1 Tax=Tasmannia lanceolata TaxID=3420 RepID=UPI004064471E